MKKIILSVVCILFASSLFAQDEEQNRHEMTVNLGGGLSTLKYNLESGKNTLGLGGSLGLGYTFFINNQFGIGTGVEANFYQSEYFNKSLIGNYRIDDSNPDTPSGYFQLNYTYKEAYREKQNALLLQIPLMLQFQTKGYHKFYAAAGGRIGFPVYSSFNTDASKLDTIVGVFEYENAFYKGKDMADYGFKPYDTPNVNGKLSLKTVAFMASLELGMKWALNDNFTLYTGIYGDYGLNDIQKTKNKGTITYNLKEARPNQKFVDFDNSVTSTSAITKITPITVGVKFRIAFGLGDTKVGSAGSKARAIKEEQDRYYRLAAEEALRRAEEARLRAMSDDDDDSVDNDWSSGRQSVSSQDMKILMEPIWGFDITKTVLTPEMKRVLDRKIPILRKYRYIGIVCEGHTCDIGSDQINERFGYERAQAVKEYFVKKGLTSTRFSTISKGKYSPAVRNDSEEHRKRNRRVELSIKK